MILRLWTGQAEAAVADDYARLLNGTIAPGILDRRIPGLQELAVWRRRAEEVDGAHEFLTAMTFSDLAAIGQFTGSDVSASVVPDEARALLSRFDDRSRHYELLQRHVPR